MTKIINNTTKIYLSLLRIQQVISVMEVDIMTYIHDFAQKGVFLICKFTYDTIHTLQMKQIEWLGNLIQFFQKEVGIRIEYKKLSLKCNSREVFLVSIRYAEECPMPSLICFVGLLL